MIQPRIGFFPLFALIAGLSSVPPRTLHAEPSPDPLTHRTDIDFSRDVSSRNLRGLAARSDGKIVAGPVFTDLEAAAPAELLWNLEAAGTNKWLCGTGPDGRVFEVKLDGQSVSTREVVKLDDSQVFAVKSTGEDEFIAGTSPHGTLYLVRKGAVIAKTSLPVDSIWDIQLLDPRTALVSTGNPGRIYRIDLAAFAKSGTSAEKVSDDKTLVNHGITRWAEVRDRNVRRLLVLSPDVVIAGSAPHGTIYRFNKEGGPPFVLQENREAEVTDLVKDPMGGFYATLVFSSAPETNRVNHPKEVEPAVVDGARRDFSGRSSVVFFPRDGFPEQRFSRTGVSIYRLQLWNQLLLHGSGDQGELLGYDNESRLSLTFPGSYSSQITALVPVTGKAGRFLLLKNNAGGFGLVDFADKENTISLETKRLDLGSAAEIGAVHFGTMIHVEDNDLKVEVRVSNSSDEIEGWSPWMSTALHAGSYYPTSLRGRYAKVKVTFTNLRGSPSLAEAAIFSRPQNRPPVLGDFKILPANLGIIPAVEPAPSSSLSLSQLVNPTHTDDPPEKRKGSFMNSQLVQDPGTQIIYWTVTDPDSDTLNYTFSIRKVGEESWTDLAVGVHESYVQFDLGPFSDGTYQTRLIATEDSPRPVAERLSVTFNPEMLVVDKTPPEILEASARRTADALVVSVHGRDSASLLEGIELAFNNGLTEKTSHPIDGVLDSREESFEIVIPATRLGNATSVQVALIDEAGNTAIKRLPISAR